MKAKKMGEITGCEKLARAFKIFGKYTQSGFPTHCEHDIMYVNVRPEDVTPEDKNTLEMLGFEPDSEFEMFSSFLFGC